MKLLFWKPKRTQAVSEHVEIKSREEYIKEYLSGGPIVNKVSVNSAGNDIESSQAADAQPPTSQKPALSTQEERKMDQVIKEVMEDRRRYKVLVIKNWCERKLTPVAYARVLVRLLPVLRDYGYDFREMQHPTERTMIKRDFFLLIQATIREIYQEEYNKKEDHKKEPV